MREKKTFGVYECHKCKKIKDCDRVNSRREFFCSETCADVHAIEHGLKYRITNKKKLEEN